MLFDTHTHVNFQPFSSDWKAVIQRALDQSVIINNVGSHWESSQRSVEIAEFFSTISNNVWASVGLHPIHIFEDVIEEQVIDGKTQKIKTCAETFDKQKYKTLAQSSDKVIAIGECGLDYLHFSRANIPDDQREVLMKKQQAVLREHIELAIELDLAVIIHCRDAAVHDQSTVRAFEDLHDMLLPYRGKLRGVVHCYTGTPELAKKFLNLGLYIGFTGIITFPNAKEVQAAAKIVPLNKIVLETDAPYLTPIPFRGKRNEPSYVQYVAAGIAKLHDCSVDEVARITTHNAIELFKIS